MNLRGIASVSSKPGLWKVLTQSKNGFILESLDAKKTKLVVNMATAKLASLEDITVFGDDGELRLIDILETMKGAASIPDQKEDPAKLRKFFDEVAPGHDHGRVYHSDIKKIISWFSILKELPLFNEDAPAPLDTTAAEAAAAASAKKQNHEDDKPKPVAKAAGKGSTRLPRKAS